MKSGRGERDLYGVLGISPQASSEEIRKAFRKLAFLWHPDRNPGDQAAEERFKSINEAYRVLGDEENRRQYDRYRTVGKPRFGTSRWPFFGGRGDWSGENHGDFQPRRGSGAYAGGCRGWKRGGCRRRHASFSMDAFSRGPEGFPSGRRPFGFHEPVVLNISPQEATIGCERVLRIRNGSALEPVLLKIPPGIENGTVIRLITDKQHRSGILLKVQIQ